MENCLFDFPTYSVNKKIRLIELFGGIGSQAMALRDIGADFEHYKLVEFDKYAVASYNAIHNTQHTTHDIRQIHAKDLEITDKDKYCYLMTYSFPCTDLSVAGKMQGMSKEEWEKGNSTRSGLLWEVERILKECTELPDVLLMENVPQVHADQNKADFDNWCNFLKSKGYINYWQDLNAKDYEIPQNRDRCFCVSILSPEFIDYEFPEGVKLEKVMKDFLEEEVDEKHYINTEKAKKLIDDLISRGELKDFKSDKLCASQSKSINGQFVSYDELTLKNIGKNIANGITARVYKGFGGDNDNAVIEKQKEAKIKKVGQISNEGSQCGTVVSDEGLAPTLSAGTHGYAKAHIATQYRIRKLTPKECWRLMGYTDEDFEKASKVNSNTQLYKQAGNAIVKQVLMAIFSQLNIKGVKAWNDMTETEKRDIIKKITMAGE